MVTKKLGSAKRFGPRYGSTPKHKLSQIEAQYNKPQECPYCKKVAVRRVAKGIWNCTKCDTKFTARAYSLEQHDISQEKTREAITIEEEQPRQQVEVAEE